MPGSVSGLYSPWRVRRAAVARIDRVFQMSFYFPVSIVYTFCAGYCFELKARADGLCLWLSEIDLLPARLWLPASLYLLHIYAVVRVRCREFSPGVEIALPVRVQLAHAAFNNWLSEGGAAGPGYELLIKTGNASEANLQLKMTLWAPCRMSPDARTLTYYSG